MEKTRVPVRRNRRSMNMQLCIAIETCLEPYEQERGPSPVESEN